MHLKDVRSCIFSLAKTLGRHHSGIYKVVMDICCNFSVILSVYFSVDFLFSLLLFYICSPCLFCDFSTFLCVKLCYVYVCINLLGNSTSGTLIFIVVYLILSSYQCCRENTFIDSFFSSSSRVVFLRFAAFPSPPSRALQDCWGFIALPDLPTCQPHLQIPAR